MSKVHEIVKKLADTAPDFVRGEWSHYPCPLCGGRGKHKWPPLGLNLATGAVNCMRCGFTMSLGGGTGQVRESKTGLYNLEEILTYEKHTRSFYDDKVDAYMKTRNLKKSRSWGYGRGKYMGMPVFPSFDPYGQVWFYQARTTNEKGSSRYLGPSTRPRLDFMHREARRDIGSTRLYVTEGPVDAARCRQVLGIWASPAYSISSTQIVRDIADGVELGLIDEVVVWYDSEYLAEVKSIKLPRKIRYTVGIPAYHMTWDTIHWKDQAYFSDQELRKIFYSIKPVKV